MKEAEVVDSSNESLQHPYLNSTKSCQRKTPLQKSLEKVMAAVQWPQKLIVIEKVNVHGGGWKEQLEGSCAFVAKVYKNKYG